MILVYISVRRKYKYNKFTIQNNMGVFIKKKLKTPLNVLDK